MATSTKERLLSSGMALIAERGFKATTVGDIEVAAGLVPRSGGLYKHFESKQALVEAALQERIDTVAAISIDATQAVLASELPRRTVLHGVAEMILAELEAEREIALIVEKEGSRFPEIRSRMDREMVQPGYDSMELVLAAWLGETTELDVPALAAVVLGALVNNRRQRWTLGRAPNDVDDERFIDTWVELVLRLVPEEA